MKVVSKNVRRVASATDVSKLRPLPTLGAKFSSYNASKTGTSKRQRR